NQPGARIHRRINPRYRPYGIAPRVPGLRKSGEGDDCRRPEPDAGGEGLVRNGSRGGRKVVAGAVGVPARPADSRFAARESLRRRGPRQGTRLPGGRGLAIDGPDGLLRVSNRAPQRDSADPRTDPGSGSSPLGPASPDAVRGDENQRDRAESGIGTEG